MFLWSCVLNFREIKYIGKCSFHASVMFELGEHSFAKIHVIKAWTKKDEKYYLFNIAIYRWPVKKTYLLLKLIRESAFLSDIHCYRKFPENKIVFIVISEKKNSYILDCLECTLNAVAKGLNYFGIQPMFSLLGNLNYVWQLSPTTTRNYSIDATSAKVANPRELKTAWKGKIKKLGTERVFMLR